jgi:hypothetical protein
MGKKGMILTVPNNAKKKSVSSAGKMGVARLVQKLDSAAKESLKLRGVRNPSSQQILLEKLKLLKR